MDLPARWMTRALTLAVEAADAGEVPVGAVLALPDGTFFEGRTRVEAEGPLRHAEMVALQAAIESLGRRGLSEAVLYVTLEPCLMCLGAMVQARIGGLVYACGEPRFGGVDTLRQLWHDGRYPHRFPVASGAGEREARDLLQGYFRDRRLDKG
jgi:tRNA(adenine34) deaminase